MFVGYFDKRSQDLMLDHGLQRGVVHYYGKLDYTSALKIAAARRGQELHSSCRATF